MTTALELWDKLRQQPHSWLPTGHVFPFVLTPNERETVLTALRSSVPSENGQTNAAPQASGAKTVSREATPAVAAPYVPSAGGVALTPTVMPPSADELSKVRIDRPSAPSSEGEKSKLTQILEDARSSETYRRETEALSAAPAAARTDVLKAAEETISKGMSWIGGFICSGQEQEIRKAGMIEECRDTLAMIRSYPVSASRFAIPTKLKHDGIGAQTRIAYVNGWNDCVDAALRAADSTPREGQ